MKQCSKCKQDKELDQFNKDKVGKYGVKSKCKLCISEYNNEYSNVNKSKIQQYYKDNKEYINSKSKEYYESNREHIIQKQIQYGKDNPEVRRKATAKYNKDNPDFYKTYRKNRYHNDPQFKLRLTLSTRLADILKKKNTIKDSSILKLLGCTLDELKQYIENIFKHNMNWDNWGKVWELDHIKPCSSFDLTDIEEQKICFHYTNLQPLYKQENRKKSNKIL